jgi:dsDNA-specific endonuclease/ATPase MutS2
MDNSAIIRHQMRVFEQCIDEARVRKLWKFVAIHGVGKGVLREAVRQCIKDEGLHYQDASYQRYGYGATEVLMK